MSCQIKISTITISVPASPCPTAIAQLAVQLRWARVSTREAQQLRWCTAIPKLKGASIKRLVYASPSDYLATGITVAMG